jgi:hypothetical protein
MPQTNMTSICNSKTSLVYMAQKAIVQNFLSNRTFILAQPIGNTRMTNNIRKIYTCLSKTYMNYYHSYDSGYDFDR